MFSDPKMVTIEDMAEGAADAACVICLGPFQVDDLVVGVDTVVICDCDQADHFQTGTCYVHKDCADTAIEQARMAQMAGLN